MPYITLSNVFGLPALVVPCGFSSEGLPVGLQLTTLPGQESLLFGAGMALEQALGGAIRNHRDFSVP